jgi:glycosyltransferase involved in cell wall biosynthesis
MPPGVVILSGNDWWYHSHGFSDIQLARAFARRLPVLFVNSIGMRFPRQRSASAPLGRIARKFRSAAHRLQFPDRALPRLAVSTPASIPAYSGLVGELNSSMVSWQISRFCAKANISDPIVIASIPTYAKVALSLRRTALFYKRSDFHSAFVGVDTRLIGELEETLFQHADAVLYANEYLFKAEQRRTKKGILIGHGVDRSLFQPEGLAAADLKDLPRPRVGFFGELRDRCIDFELIAAAAHLLPSIQFVLGGTQFEDLGELRTLSNVRVLPACAHYQVPERWRAVDVAILPYRKNAYSLAVEPVKLNEILAMGLRAVGTSIPALEQHPGTVEIADGPEAFATALHRLLTEEAGTDAKMREFRRATLNLRTWESVADQIEGILRRTVSTDASTSSKMAGS